MATKKNKTPRVTILTRTYKNGKMSKPKKTTRALSKVELDLLGPKANILMASADFKANWEAKKQQIIDSYKNISSPPFVKIIRDVKSGLTVLVQSSPNDERNINKSEATVFMQTIVGDINYVEHVKFQNLKRACEYTQDFSQAQSQRFCETAIRAHKRNIVAKNTPALKLITDGAPMKKYPDLDK